MLQTDMSAKMNYSMRVFYATEYSDCSLVVYIRTLRKQTRETS